MPRLGVNIDHVATLRQARLGTEPEPILAALAAESAGADSIVAHLREDRRHIQEKDLLLLKKLLKVKLNLEMSLAKDIIDFACRLKPDQVTIVPEKRRELTTEGGLDVIANRSRIKEALVKFNQAGIGVSLFIDPDKKQIDAAKKININLIELHTGRYSQAKNKSQSDKFFQEIKNTANYAFKKKMQVFAGHGLDYNNVSRIAGIKQITELNIGHSIICKSVFVGINQAVRTMKELIK